MGELTVQGNAAVTSDVLVLRMRLETIRTNLEQVRSAKDFVMGRYADITRIVALFERGEDFRAVLRDAIKLRITTALANAQTLIVDAGTQEENLAEVTTSLASALAKLDAVEDLADRTEKVARAMGDRWSSLSSNAALFDTHIDDIFRRTAENLIKKVDSIDLADARAAWKTYREEVRDQSDALFSEYIEFLGGLALRDTGLGGLPPRELVEGQPDEQEAEYNRDVCAMADDLIRQIYYIGKETMWHSMAVPGRAGPIVLTASRMVRLGIPDWTVWAVPLATFQFGLVVVDENDLVADFHGPRTVSDAELRVVFADAIATYSAGPAYAFASVFTKLEPGAPLSRGSKDPLTDTERVRMILATLEFMDADDDFVDVVAALRAEWAASVAQYGADDGRDQDAPDRVADWSAHMNVFLRDKGRDAKFGPQRWKAAMKWPALTDDGTSDAALEELPSNARSVSFLLNAAWYQRLGDDADPRKIAVGALKYWRSLSQRSASESRPTFRGGLR